MTKKKRPSSGNCSERKEITFHREYITDEEETQMKKRYKMMFNLEGAIEVVASCEDDAEEMVADMDRGDLLKDCDECGFSVSLYEMDEEE